VRGAMVKEAGEAIEAAVDFFGKPKLVLTVFIGSAAWVILPIRRLFPGRRSESMCMRSRYPALLPLRGPDTAFRDLTPARTYFGR
jgi:hypothetical protein